MSIENYKKFLKILQEDLDKIFEYQSEYIFCKEGCSYCCEKGEYPVSALEFQYMKQAYDELDEEIKDIIKKNIEKLKTEPKKMYKCPFLVNKKCSIYHNRALVCRTFGIMTQAENGDLKVPFCHTFGLNYSNIYDENIKKLSFELYEKGKFQAPPKPFNLEPKDVMNFVAKELNIEFGERRRLIDWF